jgi:xanthine dehydrogenase small subunit
MIRFILNNLTVETDLPKGTTVLDFVRYHKNLKGTKIGCREGDCGACTILVGTPEGEKVKYRTQTSCLMPLANAAGKHVVTVEGVNRPDGELTEVQRALVEESGTQCGFCTVGFVMSLTGFCLDETPKTTESAVSAIDGNICRCTGYKSIERGCGKLAGSQRAAADGKTALETAVEKEIVPPYFSGVRQRLEIIRSEIPTLTSQLSTLNSRLSPPGFAAGGTDLYVQRPEEMVGAEAENLFDQTELRFIEETDEFIDIGASTVVTDLLESEIFRRIFPNLYKHLKLVSSTPIRNMATLAGNFVNASPIGDMTAWFLALDAEISISTGTGSDRSILLRDFYLGYKQLAKTADEFITKIRFRKNLTHFNFEKVCKRTHLDIASVNTAIGLKVSGGTIEFAHVSAGGVFATPLYLRKTSEFLGGREISEKTIAEAASILQTEISPISDVRGSAEYKRLLARQLFTSHFVEMFDPNL